MLTLPDPPEYRGESSKDDLPAFLHEFGMWEKKVRSTASSITTEKVLDLVANAFLYRLQALEWYELNKENILTRVQSVTKPVQTHPATSHFQEFHSSFEEFGQLAGDQEQPAADQPNRCNHCNHGAKK